MPDKGDTTWMLVSTILVILMTLPGLALFYGGLVRAKNMLSVLMQVLIGFSLIAILWVVYGYSLAFTDGGGLNTFVGGFSKLFLAGVNPGTVGRDLLARRRHSGADLRRLPADLRGHHPGADHRRDRRAHQILGGAVLHRAVVHLLLPADGAHGLVVGRSGIRGHAHG